MYLRMKQGQPARCAFAAVRLRTHHANAATRYAGVCVFERTPFGCVLKGSYKENHDFGETDAHMQTKTPQFADR